MKRPGCWRRGGGIPSGKITAVRVIFAGTVALLAFAQGCASAALRPVWPAASAAVVHQADRTPHNKPAESTQPSNTPSSGSQSKNSQLAAEENKDSGGYKLSPERYAEAIAYSRAEYRLYFIGFVYGVAILWMILRFGIARRFRDWAEAVSGTRAAQIGAFVSMLSITIGVLELPIRIYGHALSLHYAQSVQGWGSWLWDWTKEEIIGLILASVLAWILYSVIRRSPRRWWLYFWVAALPVTLLLVFSGPLIIDPLFNKFEPLERSHPELVQAIERVVQRAAMDIPSERMFLMSASEKSNQINAYVTGIGASKRVVVWDNTIRHLSVPETLFIFGHEMGHYVLHHIWKGFTFFAVFLLLLLFAGFHALHWTLGRWGGSWGIYGVEDLASLPVVVLLLSITLFLSSPIINGYSRHQEHEADIYGLEVIHGIVPNSQEVAAHAFQVLGEIDLSDPEPPASIAFWLYSHPPLAERLAFARSYDPWSKGESPRFVK